MQLTLQNLTKSYKDHTAVAPLTLTLGPGVHGLLGANDAGKTTLMRMICGVLRPTGGAVRLDGEDAATEAYRARLGYLPQDFGYYPEFTGLDFLLYMAALKGLPRPAAKRKAGELLELVGLDGVARKKVRTWSGGMKQRLGIAQALLGDPDLLVLDEPTAGLDPGERVRFREIIGELGKHSIVLLSTHIVSDVERVADEILLLRDGELIYRGPWGEEQGDLEAFYLSKFGARPQTREGSGR